MREYDRVLRDHVTLVTKAADFAARRHLGQTRKGAAREPYLNHLSEVAALLAESLEEPRAWLVAAGWLHDVVEDTETTIGEVESLFAHITARMVAEVTDDKSLPKDERKRLQVVNTPKKSDDAKLIKLADKISNLRALASSPPDRWDEERIRAYIDWAEKVVVSARGLNVKLDAAFDEASEAARAAVFSRRLASVGGGSDGQTLV